MNQLKFVFHNLQTEENIQFESLTKTSHWHTVLRTQKEDTDHAK